MAMELDNSFTVPVPPDQAWDVLLDVQRIAPCMPGATVDEVEGDVVNGRIKVKVGPVSLTYRGTAKFTERDPDARRVVMEASGKETRGAGTAAATVRASLAPDASGDGTQVTMHTTMNVTGPAQFGRGVMVEVGGKLIDQFAANLAQLIAGDSGAEDSGGHASDGAAAVGASVDGASAPTATADGPSGNGSGAAASPVASTAAGPVVSTTAGPAASTAAGPVVSTTAGPEASTTAPAQEDSLNLLKVAGPAILKRLVPVLVGAVGLALFEPALLASPTRAGAGRAGLAAVDFTEVVRRRHMVRRFTDEPVSAESLDRILGNAVRGPSAGFSQGQAFLVLTGEDLKRFWNVAGEAAADPVTTAPLVIVPMSCKRVYLDRYARPDKGWTDRDEKRWPVPFWHIDTGMAALLILLTVVDEGLGALYFGIVPEAVGPFREAFGVPDDHEPIGAIAIGHNAEAAPRDLRARRRPAQDVIHYGRW